MQNCDIMIPQIFYSERNEGMNRREQYENIRKWFLLVVTSAIFIRLFIPETNTRMHELLDLVQKLLLGTFLVTQIYFLYREKKDNAGE